ncbi:alfa-L-rhamnosidase [Dactylonectria macrodidyma]|uniref:alpha-L-rhamnosidase n=1 Tax=Dactylonectria macrodidyma TaxID=307937 RepID=A0A9P9JHH5_9HYPO|nr:alfa-L-rhamnosidase [Dactylonectria macrodidyma]
MSVSISQVSFEHHRQALGIGEPEPRISWRFEGTAVDWEQRSYDIEVKRGIEGFSNTYHFESSESQLVPWPEKPLQSGDYAKVRVRAHGLECQVSTPWSRYFDVEAGLLDEESWSGVLAIATGRESKPDEPKCPIYFRKSFSTGSAAISSARLYVTALGLYEAYINGHRVGDDVLAPGWQSYHHRHVYHTYDVTDLVSRGENAIGVIVGEGWYSGRLFSFDPSCTRNHYGSRIGSLALLVVRFEDGTLLRMPTDTSWKSNTGPIVDSQIYDGEIYDSRLEDDFDGWSSASFNTDLWHPTIQLPSITRNLTSPDGPPIRRIEERAPQKIWKSPSGKTLIDFGQNIAGWLRVRSSGPSGTKITLSHAEVLENGELSIETLRTAKARDIFILNGRGSQTFEPHFTFHGFRFVQVDGWPKETPLTPKSFQAVSIHTDMERTGWFTCSNPLLNQFHQNVLYSMKGNFLSIPSDCPQRDERMGWTGDVTVFGPTANFLYDCSGFWRGWHRDVWSEMKSSGAMIVPHYVPNTAPNRECSGNWPPVATAIWGDVAVSGPWQIWKAYGDMALLKEQYEQSSAWIDSGVVRDDLGLWNKSGFQWGDWLDPLSPESDPGAATTKSDLVADAYLIGMTDLLTRMSYHLGEDVKAEKYKRESKKLRQAFADVWLHNGSMVDRTQTAYSLAIYFDLFLHDSDRENAAQALRQLVAENGYLVGTGFAATWILGHALRKIGATEDFYKMLLQTRVPSWLYQVVMGGTTTWERWNSLMPDGSVNGSGMTSFNHYAFGSVADWIHQTIGGLASETPGWKTVMIAPVPGGGITSADTSFLSGYGLVRARWWFEDHEDETAKHRNGFHLHVWVPPNSKGIIKMPHSGQVINVGSGFHEFHENGFLCPK